MDETRAELQAEADAMQAKHDKLADIINAKPGTDTAAKFAALSEGERQALIRQQRGIYIYKDALYERVGRMDLAAAEAATPTA